MTRAVPEKHVINFLLPIFNNISVVPNTYCSLLNSRLQSPHQENIEKTTVLETIKPVEIPECQDEPIRHVSNEAVKERKKETAKTDSKNSEATFGVFSKEALEEIERHLDSYMMTKPPIPKPAPKRYSE